MIIKGKILWNISDEDIINGHVDIPDTVKSIGDYAFRGCTGLTSVTIPDSVESIGYDAFYNCTGLKEVHISDLSAWCKISFVNSVANPLTYAHSLYLGDNLINNLVIPSGVTSIGDYAFYNCTGLTSITIPSGVTRIGKSAFYECSGLTSVTIGNSVKSIGDSAFYRCTGLTSVTIGNSVESIGNYAFEYCYKLIEVINHSSLNITVGSSSYGSVGYCAKHIITDSQDSYLTEKDGYIFYDDGSNVYLMGYSGTETKLTLPEKSPAGKNYQIYQYAFSDCTGLTSVTIGNGVESIDYWAFFGCTGLTSVTIGNSVESVGDWAFCSCTGLTSVTIPSSIVNIGKSAFRGCSGLKSITFAEDSQCSGIGDGAFSGCSSLESMTIPFVGNTKDGTSKTHFGYIFGAYYYPDNSSYVPKSLKTVVITGGTSIGDSAFQNCTGLTSVTIPASVKTVGSSAFYYCSGLKSVTFAEGSQCESIGSSAFSGCSSLESITIPASVKTVGSGAFYNCSGLKSATFAEGSQCESINGFSGCTGLTSVTIPNSVESIGEHAFRGCTGLTSVTIPDSVESIGKCAFLYCRGLTSVTIPNRVTSIGKDAFYDCAGLTKVTFAEGSKLTSIGWYAFRNCTGLTSVTIPNSVESIGGWAFCGCTGLESIIVESSNTKYHSAGNCLIETSSKTLILGCKNSVIPSDGSVMSIGSFAFYWCSGLISVTIPNSVKSIGDRAFYDCTGLTKVTIPGSVTSIGVSAFYGCDNLKNIGKFKATNADLTCLGFHFEIGKWHEEQDVKLCQRGFHYCENAFDIFNYYHGEIGKDVRFFELEVDNVSEEHKIDSKHVCGKIKLVREIKSYAELLN